MRMALGALALAVLAPAPASAELLAGSGAGDLTPPIGTPMFAYTARSGSMQPDQYALGLVADKDGQEHATTFVPSRGIQTRVLSRAIVLQSGGQKYALVQVDLGGIPLALIQETMKRLAGTGITQERLLVSATHTHSSTGPIWPNDSSGYAALGGDTYQQEVFSLTADGIAESIKQANANLQPAKVGVATAEAKDASRNRAFTSFRRNKDVPKSEAEARKVAADPTVTVVRVDATNGSPLGVWSNFAQHQTSFGDENLLFSGDNAAFAERIVEDGIRREAARRRQTPAGPIVNVWTNGAEGDISPDGGAQKLDGEATYYSGNSFGGAHLAGAKAATAILQGWRDAGRRMSATVPVTGRQGYLEFDGTQADGEPVGPIAFLGAGGVGGPDGLCAPADNFAGPGQGMKFPTLGGPGDSIVPGTAAVAIFRIGSLAIASFPSEITKQMGERIRKSVATHSAGAFSRVALAGLSNGYISYTSTPEEYDACNYEGSFTLFGRRQGPRYLNFAKAVTTALLKGGSIAGAVAEPPQSPGTDASSRDVRATPEAGKVVAQPKASINRYGMATFRWRGGDPSVDAPRGGTFVTLERQAKGGAWTVAGTDDAYFDTVARDDEDVWTETWQFNHCNKLGNYRFRVVGVADRGAGPTPYAVTSNPFAVGRIENLKPGTLQVRRGRATVKATYPDPGKTSILALPRLVRHGYATLKMRRGGKTRRVKARQNRAKTAYTARVPTGWSVRLVSIRDGCGNTGAP